MQIHSNYGVGDKELFPANRKLTRSFDSVKKIFLKIVIGVVLACILFVCFLYTNNEIGVTSSKLEADIRSSQPLFQNHRY